MKKTITRVLLIIIAIVVVIIGFGFIYLMTAFPDIDGAPDIVIERTAERIERGKYLANNVMECIGCHSKRDFSKFSGPVVPGTEGMGGEKFDQSMNFPGKFFAPNITPAALGNWTDGEIFRAITSGVSKDGRPMFEVMPYHNYGKLDREDIYSVIAYIRTLDPIENEVPVSEADFPVNLILRTMPKKPSFTKKPSKSDIVKYGEYMLMAAGCYNCHTERDEKGNFIGEPFAGGMKFQFPDGTKIISKDITFSSKGIGSWSEEQFIKRFKMYADSNYTLPNITNNSHQTVMPWTLYAGMTEFDLKSIYAYLKSLR